MLQSDSDWVTVHILRQVLNIHDGTSVLLFSDGSTLLHSELDSFILSLAINRVSFTVVVVLLS